MRSDITAKCRQRGPVPLVQIMHSDRTIKSLAHLYGMFRSMIEVSPGGRFPPIAVISRMIACTNLASSQLVENSLRRQLVHQGEPIGQTPFLDDAAVLEAENRHSLYFQ